MAPLVKVAHVCRKTVIVMVTAVLMGEPAFAQGRQASATREEEYRRAQSMIRVGAGLAGGGLLLLPLTALAGDKPVGEYGALSGGLVVAGAVLMVKGASDRRKASSPSIVATINAGRGLRARITYRW